MLTFDEIKKQLEVDPAWQPEADEDWEMYDQVVEAMAKDKKAMKAKPDPDRLFDETFPQANTAHVGEEEDF